MDRGPAQPAPRRPRRAGRARRRARGARRRAPRLGAVLRPQPRPLPALSLPHPHDAALRDSATTSTKRRRRGSRPAWPSGYAIFGRVFEHDPASRLPIVLYANRADFRQTSVAPGDLVDDEGGVTGIVRRRIALSFDVTLRESDRAIGHELVHAFQFDMTRRHSWAGGAPGASRLPRWFIDGMAEYLSHGPGRSRHGHVGARRRRPAGAAGHPRSQPPDLLAVPLGPGVLDLRRGPVRRRRARRPRPHRRRVGRRARPRSSAS